MHMHMHMHTKTAFEVQGLTNTVLKPPIWEIHLFQDRLLDKIQMMV